MHMDEFLDAIAESLAHAGPEYVTALGLVAIAAWVVAKALPLYAGHQDKRLGIEQQREQRKAAEEASREQRDRERSEMEGRWVAKALPLYAGHQDKRLGIEQQREQRKAAEEASREQRDRERSEMEGRWLTQYEHATHVQEQTNAVMEGVRAQMNTLNVTLQDSKSRSADMAREVREIHEVVTNR